MKSPYDFSSGKRGRILTPEPEPGGKVRITIRLDKDIVDHFMAKADESGGEPGRGVTTPGLAILSRLQAYFKYRLANVMNVGQFGVSVCPPLCWRNATSPSISAVSIGGNSVVPISLLPSSLYTG